MPSTSKGSILWSGGLDSTALGLLLTRWPAGERLQPVYCCHRQNGGNVTRKELEAAADLADWVLGRELLILYWERPKGPPSWLAEFGAVEETRAMPVDAKDKDWRNRRMIEALDEYGLADGKVALGVFLTPRDKGAERRKDMKQSELAKGVPGELVTPRVLGIPDKTALLEAVGRRGDAPEQLWSTQSCLMWFAKHCGNCWSCVDRATAMMKALGEDRTDYRKNSTAWKLARGEG
jgi:hypothetical protein